MCTICNGCMTHSNFMNEWWCRKLLYPVMEGTCNQFDMQFISQINALVTSSTKSLSNEYFSECYFLFCHFSGLDVVGILEYFGLNSTSSTITNNVASGASTFVVAYAVHKVFAPFRISITLVSAPFIVRFLRNKGILAAKPTKKTINSWHYRKVKIFLAFNTKLLEKKHYSILLK